MKSQFNLNIKSKIELLADIIENEKKKNTILAYEFEIISVITDQKERIKEAFKSIFKK